MSNQVLQRTGLRPAAEHQVVARLSAMRARRSVERIKKKAPPLHLPRLEYVFEKHRRRPANPYWCLRVCEVVKPADGKRVAALSAARLRVSSRTTRRGS